MGLDIYFYRVRTSDAINGDSSNDLWSVLNRASSDAYFRKANFIYGFFSHIIDENEMCVAHRIDIEMLRDACKRVLTHRDEGYSKQHLPTYPGFFFGGLEYDKWYYEKVEDCYEKMRHCLDTMSDDECYIIWFSW